MKVPMMEDTQPLPEGWKVCKNMKRLQQGRMKVQERSNAEIMLWRTQILSIYLPEGWKGRVPGGWMEEV